MEADEVATGNYFSPSPVIDELREKESKRRDRAARSSRVTHGVLPAIAGVKEGLQG
jgi:hypothetical protein